MRNFRIRTTYNKIAARKITLSYLALSKPRFFLDRIPSILLSFQKKNEPTFYHDFLVALSLSNQFVFLSSANFLNKSICFSLFLKSFRILSFVPLCSWKFWNTSVCSSLLLKVLWNTLVCSSLLWQKFWDVSVYSSLFLKSFGTKLFYPLSFWGF